MLRLRSRPITLIARETSKAHKALVEDPQYGVIRAFQEDVGIKVIRQVPSCSKH